MILLTLYRDWNETNVFYYSLCHICAIMVGAASALALTTPLVIANDWFPHHERTTAVGEVLVHHTSELC